MKPKISATLEHQIRYGGGPVMVIACFKVPEADENLKQLHPKDFPTRKEYRQAAIDINASAISKELSEDRKVLENLGLMTPFEMISPIKILRISSSQLDDVLALPHLISLSGDQKMSLIEPVR